MSPIDPDKYGKFYGTGLFKKLFPNYASGQAESAKQISQRILTRCGIDSGLPTIKRVIDLGCGDGRLLRGIQMEQDKHAKKSHRNSHHPHLHPDGAADRTAIEFFGFDISAKAIQKAKNTKSRCTFIPYNGRSSDLLTKIPDEESLWKSTALLVLGHTWFHLLNQSELIDFIKTRRPALIVIDLYHNWDETVELITKKQYRNEPIHIDPKHGTYCLRSEIIDGNPQRMLRGICKVDHKGKLDWLVPTDQVAAKSEMLFGKREDFSDLEQAQETGQLTGTCNYVVRKQFRHESGWGPMNCYGLVPLDPKAAQINNAWHEVVCAQVKNIFVSPALEGEPKFSGIRRLLKIHDEPREWQKRTGFAGSREVLTIQPFDCHATFARVVGLFPGDHDAKIGKYSLISELPNSDQRRFPTAYGLFRSIEDRISSPQAFPLKWAHDYDQSDVDGKHNDLEELILGIKKTARSGNTFKDKDLERGYFILPVFFGSLPFFALVLKFPNLLPITSTGASVFHAALTNLHDQIKVIMVDQFIRNHILSPFISGALNSLHLQFASDKMQRLPPKRCRIETYLQWIEDRLFGLAKTESKQATWEERDGGIINKDWKSWILTIPSQPIKELQSVKAENNRLWRLWEEEKRRTLMDHELRISYWFQEGRFFESQAHDQWRTTEHTEALRRMLAATGVCNDRPLTDQIDDLGCQNYFARCCVNPDETHYHYLLTWAQDTLRKLVEPTTSESDKQALFGDLKATFCKTWENKGKGMRFSWLRLWAHLDAAREQSDSVTISPRITIQKTGPNCTWHKDCNGPDNQYHCASDPTVTLGEMCNALVRMQILANTTLTLRNWDKTPPIAIGVATLIFNLKEPLDSAIGGADCMRLRHHCALLWARHDIAGDLDAWLYTRVVLTLDVKLTQQGHQLTFAVSSK